jgi:hypothetical protein
MNSRNRLAADFERFPPGVPRDETDLSLRAYVSRIADEKLRAYRPDWTDDQLIAWDGNFRSDGCLMLVCCERDVDAAELRRVVDEYIAFRQTSGDPIG